MLSIFLYLPSSFSFLPSHTVFIDLFFSPSSFLCLFLSHYISFPSPHLLFVPFSPSSFSYSHTSFLKLFLLICFASLLFHVCIFHLFINIIYSTFNLLFLYFSSSTSSSFVIQFPRSFVCFLSYFLFHNDIVYFLLVVPSYFFSPSLYSNFLVLIFFSFPLLSVCNFLFLFFFLFFSSVVSSLLFRFPSTLLVYNNFLSRFTISVFPFFPSLPFSFHVSLFITFINVLITLPPFSFSFHLLLYDNFSVFMFLFFPSFHSPVLFFLISSLSSFLSRRLLFIPCYVHFSSYFAPSRFISCWSSALLFSLFFFFPSYHIIFLFSI